VIGHLAYATGSPCPTLVLDSRKLPGDDDRTLAYLAEARRYLAAGGGEHVLKIALVRPSEHPMFDLDYQFVQALPAGPDAFDLRGSCGHSILSAVVAAEKMDMVDRLSPGGRTRVRVLNNGDQVVCEIDRIQRNEAEFTVHFVRPQPVPLSDLLILEQPRLVLPVDGGLQEVSLVSSGNAYAFVDGRTLGVHDHEELFAAGEELFDRLSRIRTAACDRLGWSREGAFPKIAAVLPVESGVAVRAISVPSWHPTIALTGAVCLGSAIRIPETVPWRVANERGPQTGVIDILTPGGRTAVDATTPEVDGTLTLGWASVERKQVTFGGSFLLQPLAHLQLEEISECLAQSAKAA
jgi:2-methylaconitate cis-trans-isomerase PrpF